ncbi:Cochaperone protein [Dionaea muscipula]
MASDLETKAKEAFIDDDFELAIDLYSQAIGLDPSNAVLFADRAQANIKLSNFNEAIADANKAIQLDPSMAKAYVRKATACIHLKDYHTAKVALQTRCALAPGDSRFSNLIKEYDQRNAEENCTLSDQQVQKAPTASAVSVPLVNNSSLGITSAKPKIRHDFYQKLEEVVVTIFAKGIPAKNVSVNYGEQILSVAIGLPGEEPYVLQLHLFGKIIPSKCRYEVLSTKIEIRLVKVEPIHWRSLELIKENIVPQKINVSSATHKPSYPSSKSTAVDWDKLEAEVMKEDKEEKLDGDAFINKLFQDVYKHDDEDARRAMNKSFVESHGTVLSNNWKEVGAKKVEGNTPDGMEIKKWEH